MNSFLVNSVVLTFDNHNHSPEFSYRYAIGRTPAGQRHTVYVAYSEETYVLPYYFWISRSATIGRIPLRFSI